MTSDDYVAFHNGHCPLFLVTRTCNCWLPDITPVSRAEAGL